MYVRGCDERERDSLQLMMSRDRIRFLAIFFHSQHKDTEYRIRINNLEQTVK